MLRSMTGFGKAMGRIDEGLVTVEVTSVNHRFLDTSLRMPGEWSGAELSLREVVKNRLARGKITVNISRKRGVGGSRPVHLDQGLAEQYSEAARKLAELIGSNEPLSVNTLAQFPGVFAADDADADMEAVTAGLSALVGEALDNLNTMRAQEGAALETELKARLGAIGDTTDRVETRLPELNAAFEEKLRARIADLAGDTAIAEERIAVEVAVLADKGDVTEEVVRLRNHIEHANEILADADAAGRKLNFLAQELQREINTLGSKVRDTQIVRDVLEMKSELEKFREQIQNVE